MSPNDRENISVLGLTIEHNKYPDEASFYATVTETSSETTTRPLGSSKDWSYKKYKEVFIETTKNIMVELFLNFPGDSVLIETYKDLAKQNNNISSAPLDSIGNPPNIKTIDARMNLTIRHFIYAVDYDEPETYVALRAEIFDSSDKLIYKRIIFGEHWIVTDKFLKKEYSNSFKKEFKNAAHMFWMDITSESEL